MTPEIPRQFNMFSREWDDNRTRRQKKLDQEQEQLKQQEMFSQREVAQFGVNPRPLLPLSPYTKLGLIFEDHRTPQEMERDIQRAAEGKTPSMFDKDQEPVQTNKDTNEQTLS